MPGLSRPTCKHPRPTFHAIHANGSIQHACGRCDAVLNGVRLVPKMENRRLLGRNRLLKLGVESVLRAAPLLPGARRSRRCRRRVPLSATGAQRKRWPRFGTCAAQAPGSRGARATRSTAKTKKTEIPSALSKRRASSGRCGKRATSWCNPCDQTNRVSARVLRMATHIGCGPVGHRLDSSSRGSENTHAQPHVDSVEASRAAQLGASEVRSQTKTDIPCSRNDPNPTSQELAAPPLPPIHAPHTGYAARPTRKNGGAELEGVGVPARAVRTAVRRHGGGVRIEMRRPDGVLCPDAFRTPSAPCLGKQGETVRGCGRASSPNPSTASLTAVSTTGAPAGNAQPRPRRPHRRLRSLLQSFHVQMPGGGGDGATRIKSARLH